MNDQSLIDHWDAVDTGVQEHFGTDTADAGVVYPQDRRPLRRRLDA